MADIELVIFEIVPKNILVPLLSKIARPMQNRNKNGSTYDSHIIISITKQIATAKTKIHVGSITIFLSATFPLV